MRGRRYRSERATAGPRSGLSPVEVISSGTGAGVWLLDSSSSRIQVTFRKFGHLLAVRGQFESVGGMIEIQPGLPAMLSLTVDGSSLRGSSVRRGLHFGADASLVTMDDPLVTFRSEHLLLVPPDQTWIIGTLTAGGRRASVAFEATATVDFPYLRATLDARIVARWRPPNDSATQRRPGTAVCVLHLEFLQQH
jgi:polyisoprenoid-binding protein YceI